MIIRNGKTGLIIMHSDKKIYGSVSINISAPYPMVISGFAILVLAFIVYGFSMDFTAMYIVKGYLNAKQGIARVYADRPGIITRAFVTVGEQVPKGAALFAVDTNMDESTFVAEQKLLQDRLNRLERAIQVKINYLHSLQPLLVKHYLSVTAYQTFRDQLTALESNRHELKMAILHHSALHSYVVRAPILGMISSLEAHVGQKVNLTQSLLTMLPHQAALVAQLYVPVSKSGFLHPGGQIALRYDAYPYQHFGVAKARIQSISQSILSDREEEKPLRIGEPYYKVIAYLDQQFIFANGQKHFLQQGMTCSAVLAGAHKKLWRWIFDPIHHYTVT